MSRYTAEDIRLLATNFRDAKDRGRAFNLLTGGGCSYTAGIPLAPALIEIVKGRYGDRVRRRVHPDRQDDYGACMGCLTTSERKDLLKPHLENAKVNWAHIAIAALLQAGYVSRVLTFNFDQVLARACGICGLYPAIYDFGVAASASVDHIVSPSIIHLHGQGYGLRLLNSEEETSRHAEALEPLLRDTLERYPLLIVGYSGMADAVFPKLAANFQGRELLVWADKVEAPNLKMKELVTKAPNTCDFLGGADADVFLIELAQALECWPPLLFNEPEGHLLREIESILDYPKELGGAEDLVSGLRRTLESARDRRKAESERKFERLMLEGKWDEVIAREGEANTNSDRREVAWAYTMQGNALSDLAERKQDEVLYRKGIASYAEALRLDATLHDGLYNWGNALLELARLKQDEALYRESFAKYAKALEIKPDKHEALNNWGNALLELALLKKDEALYRESFAKYAEAVQIKPDKYEALNNWGNALLGLARLKQDETLYQEAIAKCTEALKIKPDMHEALHSWGIALSELARQKQDEALYREAIAKCAEALKIKPDKYTALNSWGIALSGLARQKQDEALYQESVAKFSRAVEIKPDYHEALNNWGIALSELARQKQDESLYRESFAKFAQASELKPNSHEVLDTWGGRLMELWDLTHDASLLEKADSVLTEADRTSERPNYNLACLRARQDRLIECREQLERCKSQGTLPDRDHLLADPDLDIVRDTKWFRELLE